MKLFLSLLLLLLLATGCAHDGDFEAGQHAYRQFHNNQTYTKPTQDQLDWQGSSDPVGGGGCDTWLDGWKYEHFQFNRDKFFNAPHNGIAHAMHDPSLPCDFREAPNP